MGANMKSWMWKILYLIIFIVCIALLVLGQRNIGVEGLLVMLVGLAGILGLMYIYNKKYQ